MVIVKIERKGTKNFWYTQAFLKIFLFCQLDLLNLYELSRSRCQLEGGSQQKMQVRFGPQIAIDCLTNSQIQSELFDDLPSEAEIRSAA